ncbi:hypothetical protein HOU03_gp415 [Caulobacter phage CcrSC]|uniref:Uncharacterized protein n=1 Tax=Caulobacter phage CcrSC TaxID=2283272 RepID=A0A385EDL1_9CAUD|nr:hypothetical protein HOU03_gp415 [Caulobacter phage CcrSC]AXQ69853.1 hypothetical protein CcrSC_gp271c [Caulobacter phage CcrSC]
MDPYQQGQLAFVQGKPRSACPYGLLSLDRWSWLDGWDFQKSVQG